MADLWAQQYVAVEAIYASRFSTKFCIRLYTVKQNALGGGGGGAVQLKSPNRFCIFMTYVA